MRAKGSEALSGNVSERTSGFQEQKGPQWREKENIEHTVSHLTPEEKEEEIFSAKKAVLGAYKAKETPSDNLEVGKENTDKKAKTDDGIPQTNEEKKKKEKKPFIKRQAEKYDEAERQRIESQKLNLMSEYWSFYFGRECDVPTRPTPLRKAVRLAFDKIGIKTKRSIARREEEARQIALFELFEEAKEKREQDETIAKDVEKRKSQDEEKRQREKEEYEKEKIKIALEEAHDNLSRRKTERFQKQRVQGFVEKDLNTRLLKTDELDEEVAAENPEVEKTSVEFEGVEIPVYTLKGLPFCLLSTTIDYRRFNKERDIGTKTFKKIMDDPAIWAEPLDKAKESDGFGTRNENARGNVISASFRNSESNFSTSANGELVYGFESVDAGSILYVHEQDAGTVNVVEEWVETFLDKGDSEAIKRLEEAGTSGYNEVLIKRYSETGIAKRPDYIIVQNGEITDAVLRHAKFFGIPIINIDTKVYSKRNFEKGEKILESINDEDSFVEISKKIEKFMAMTDVAYGFHRREAIGRRRDEEEKNYRFMGSLNEKCTKVSELEFTKRLEFIQTAIRDAIKKLEEANKREEAITDGFEELFEYFNISVVDVHKEGHWHAPGNCNWIDINFKLKDSCKSIETRIYDGKHIYKPEDAWNLTQEDIDFANNQDVQDYDVFIELVNRYFEAKQKNNQIRLKN